MNSSIKIFIHFRINTHQNHCLTLEKSIFSIIQIKEQRGVFFSKSQTTII